MEGEQLNSQENQPEQSQAPFTSPLNEGVKVSNPSKIILLLSIILVLILGVGGYFVFSQKTGDNIDVNIVTCTADAKMCPDGSSVARVAPSCEFAECKESQEEISGNKNQYLVGDNYIVSDNEVYFIDLESGRSSLVQGVDIDTFENLGGDGFARDKDNIYDKGEKGRILGSSKNGNKLGISFISYEEFKSGPLYILETDYIEEGLFRLGNTLENLASPSKTKILTFRSIENLSEATFYEDRNKLMIIDLDNDFDRNPGGSTPYDLGGKGLTYSRAYQNIDYSLTFWVPSCYGESYPDVTWIDDYTLQVKLYKTLDIGDFGCSEKLIPEKVVKVDLK